VAFFKSGVDPVVVGLVVGLLINAYAATRSELEQASDAFRLFREQPTAELAQSAREVVRTAISPSERLQLLCHPWSSYIVVPLFALANAGIVISGSFLARAYAPRRASPGSCSERWSCCHPGSGCARCSARPRPSPTSWCLSTGTGTTSAGRRTPR
jgi:hypothetical protein